MIHVDIIPIIPKMQNYSYVLRADNGQIALIDPGDAAPILAFLKRESLTPDMILITHFHWDHIDGVPEILKHFDIPVIGPAYEADKIPTLTQTVREGDVISFGGEDITVIHTPGHTMGEICFHAPQSKVLFSGDTLFSMGCGRLFEGTAEEMWGSFEKLMALPDDTQIYCGHEYTLSNAAFCIAHDPDNEALKTRLKEVQALRDNGQPTLPVSLQTEKQTNIFLRAGSAARFAEFRALKDHS